MARERHAKRKEREEHHIGRRPCELDVQQHHDYDHGCPGKRDILVICGDDGFKGSRKSTPYAAQVAAEDAGKKAAEHGMKNLEVEVQGPGSGRESALARFTGSCWFRDHVNSGRNTDTAQWLSPTQASPRLNQRSRFSCAVHRPGLPCPGIRHSFATEPLDMVNRRN